jgi:hypothetical protein
MPSIGPNEIFIFVGIALLLVWPWCRVFAKAGHPAWYGLSILIPLLNVIGLLYLAFSEWPSRRDSLRGPAGGWGA